MKEWLSHISRGGISALALGALLSASPAQAAGWMQQTTGVTWNFTAVDFLTEEYGIAVTDTGRSLITSNGGETWSTGTVFSGRGMNDVTWGDDHAWAVGNNGTIMKSTDGGVTWTAQTSGVTSTLFAIDMSDNNIGVVVGANGVLLMTTDGGSTWTRKTTGITNTLFDVAYIDEISTGVAVGASGRILVTTDNGATWSNSTSGVTTSLFDAVLLPSVEGNTAIAVGASGKYLTSDNLSTWTSVNTGAASSEVFRDVVAGMSNMHITLIGDAGVYVSTDLGDNWNFEAFTGLKAADGAMESTAVWAAGNTGKMYRFIPTTPSVSSISPTAATVGSAVTLSATYEHYSNVESCNLFINGVDQGEMAVADGTASKSYTPTSTGTLTAVVSCMDVYGDVGASDETTITVSAADTTAPTVGSVTPTSATAGTAVTLSASYSDAVGVSSCTLSVGGVSQGTMTLASGTASKSYTFSTSTYPSGGTASAQVTCVDAAGNTGTGATTSITVAAAASGDSDESTSTTDVTAPTVGAISPSTAIEDTAVTLRASVADSVGVTGCTLYVNSANAGSMTITGGYATASYTFDEAGTGIANAYCWDAAGNTTRGASTTITIESATSEEEEAAAEAEPGNLLKLACDGDSDVNDPCRAVYYYSEVDGKRHAFPNEKVFFSWYASFDDVIIVTDDFMASLTLGRNVTYKPGVTMVKFVTVNTVYAVGAEGELRAIDSEDTARSIWGSTWNQQIHDISDAFFSNYEFGEDINNTSDYDPDNVEDLYNTIDELLEAQS